MNDDASSYRHAGDTGNPSAESTRWWAPWALPVCAEPVRNALLTIDRLTGRITDVTENVPQYDARRRGAEIFADCTLIPGFVNAHSHIEYASYDGIGDGLPFDRWIVDHTIRKRRLSNEQQLRSAELGAWQSVASGISTTADASFGGHAADAMHAVGMRGFVHLELFGRDNEQAILNETLAHVAAIQKRVRGNDRIKIGLSPHAPYTVSPRLFELVADSGLPWSTHMSESAAERAALHPTSAATADGYFTAWVRTARGGTPMWSAMPLIQLAQHLSTRTIVAHGVHADDEELTALAQSGAGLAHCPRSNARLGCGVLDVAHARKLGVAVGLGTDSPSSAGPIDMFAEMRAAIELQRAARQSPAALDARGALALATAEAARALNLSDLGILRAGAHADVVAVHTGPTQEPTIATVLRGSPDKVRATMVAGRIVWRHDWRDLQRAIDAAEPVRILLEQVVDTADAAPILRIDED